MPLLPNKANTEDNNATSEDRSALPAGQYLVHIVKSEMKETKAFKAGEAEKGHYLALTMPVLEGDRKGSVLFENLNLSNDNPIAEEIANKTLNSICVACEKSDVEDSDELHQIPMLVTVKVNAATANFPEGNSITAYESADDYQEDEAEEEKPKKSKGKKKNKKDKNKDKKPSNSKPAWLS